MHRSLLPMLIAASGVLAAPQNTGLENLSQCAQGAALFAVGSTNCAISDTACLCTGTAFQDALRNAIAASCGPADVAAAEAFGAATCASVGVPVPSNSASATDPSATPPPTSDGEGEYEYEGDADATPPPATDDTTADPISAPADSTTVWVNGTCHHCPGGDAHTNGTAPPPANPPAGPSGTGSGNPLFTGAANALWGSGLSVLAAVAVAVAALL